MNHRLWTSLIGCLAAVTAGAQQGLQHPSKLPFDAAAPSTLRYFVENGAETLEIANVQFEIAGPGIPGRPVGERLVLRHTIRTRQVVDEKGVDASSVVEAWPLGVDLKQQPLYSLTVPGIDPRILGGGVLQLSRGLEDVEWWSVYRLGSGTHLLDTYVPLVRFSLRGETRYAGLDVPPDDSPDPRLTAPNVLAVLTYASPEKVIREVLLTCDDPQRARLLRSYFDSTRTMTYGDGAIRITFRQNPPLPPDAITVTIPVVNDDLAAAGKMPDGVRVAVWKR